MNKCFPIFLFFFFGFLNIVVAQLPNTQAYLFDMRQVSDDVFEFANPKYLTSFNKDGYNNQPHFINERVLYLTVQSKNGTQSDIYSLDLYRKIKTQITDTPDSEYSPTIVPNSSSFSCVREENDGNKTQRLWQFPIDRSNAGKRVLDKTGVGYHAWLTPEDLALFMVGTPHKLILTNKRTGTSSEIATNIGRSLQQFPSGNLVYLEKESENTWYIKQIDPKSKKSAIVIEALKGSEDFIIASDGTIFSGKGSKLYKHNPSIDSNWIEIGDFAAYGIRNITRLAYNGNRKLVLISKKT